MPCLSSNYKSLPSPQHPPSTPLAVYVQYASLSTSLRTVDNGRPIPDVSTMKTFKEKNNVHPPVLLTS